MSYLTIDEATSAIADQPYSQDPGKLNRIKSKILKAITAGEIQEKIINKKRHVNIDEVHRHFDSKVLEWVLTYAH